MGVSQDELSKYLWWMARFVPMEINIKLRLVGHEKSLVWQEARVLRSFVCSMLGENNVPHGEIGYSQRRVPFGAEPSCLHGFLSIDKADVRHFTVGKLGSVKPNNRRYLTNLLC